MRAYNPLPPTGTDPEAVAMQAMLEVTHGPSGQLCDSSTVKVRRTSRGIFFSAAPKSKSAGGGGAATLFALKNPRHANYLECNPYNSDGSIDTGNIVKIAKPYKLRCSITTATFPNGDIITYDYSPYLPGGARFILNTYEYVRRDATIAGISITERQIIVPWYLDSDEITALKLSSPVTVKDDLGADLICKYIEAGPRHWATKADQTT